jgi:hypothetical protein
MKAYITCPATRRQERHDLLPIIEDIVRKNDIEPFVFQVDMNPETVFERDKKNLETATHVIAEVSEASHGVGAEIGIAHMLGLKIILLLEKGKILSRLIQGVPGAKIIEYSDIEELKDKLNLILQEK